MGDINNPLPLLLSSFETLHSRGGDIHPSTIGVAPEEPHSILAGGSEPCHYLFIDILYNQLFFGTFNNRVREQIRRLIQSIRSVDRKAGPICLGPLGLACALCAQRQKGDT
jgi:hypothetical protein